MTKAGQNTLFRLFQKGFQYTYVNKSEKLLHYEINALKIEIESLYIFRQFRKKVTFL